MSGRIYLDHNATTPVDPRVLAAMLPYFSEHFGNAASITHGLGCDAAGASEVARAEVAGLINAQAKDIIFTSGATESVNLALLGVARRSRDKGRHVVTVATEHRAGLEACEQLVAEGFSVTVVGVDGHGLVDLEALARALTPGTTLLSCMHANNEIGTVAELALIGRLAKGAGVLLHVDGAQSLGKEPIDVEAMGIDLLSLSAHKLYGPKGVGALYLRRREPRVRLQPLLHGGGHERGLRPGTLNVPGIVGFGAACRIAGAEMAEERVRLRALKERMWQGLQAAGGLTRLGHPERCLAGTLNVVFAGINAQRLLVETPQVAASLGAACTSVTPKPSHVLRAIGVGWRLAEGALRLSLGRWTTAAEVDEAAALLRAGVVRQRSLRPAAHGDDTPAQHP
jgi:cysteine desulfurase